MSQSRSGGSLFAGSGGAAQTGIAPPNQNLASSFNSGLNTVGLNNGYQNGGGGGTKFSGARTWGPSSTGNSWLGKYQSITWNFQHPTHIFTDSVKSSATNINIEYIQNIYFAQI